MFLTSDEPQGMPTGFFAVLDELDRTLDDTSENMARLIESEVPEYRAFPTDADSREWREGLRWALGLFASLQRRPTAALSPDETRAIETIGMRRADQRMELGAVLRSVRLAMYAAHRVVSGIAESVAGDEAFAVVDTMTFRMTCFINDFSDAVSRGYMIRRDEHVAERERGRSQFFLDLVTGAFATYDVVAHQARAVDAAVSERAGLVLVPSHSRGSAALLADIRRSAPEIVVIPMTSASCPHAALLVAEDEWQQATKQIAEAAKVHRVVAFSAGVLDVPTELCERYVEASSLLAVASSTEKEDWLVPTDDLAYPYIVAHARAQIAAIVERRALAALRDHTKLLDALDAYFRSSGSPKGAALLLGVSETTARSHRTKIESVTGLCFDRPADVLWLGLAWASERNRRTLPP